MEEIARLVEPQIPSLRRYAYALLRDRDAADDLVQDTLERAVAGWPRRRAEGDLRAWLFAIERNLFLQIVRRRTRGGSPLGMEALDSVPAPIGDPDEALAARDVLAELDGLPEEQRSVVLLVAIEDLSYAEAATVLGVPVGTVMSRLSRARDRLRRFMETGRIVTLRRVK